MDNMQRQAHSCGHLKAAEMDAANSSPWQRPTITSPPVQPAHGYQQHENQASPIVPPKGHSNSHERTQKNGQLELQYPWTLRELEGYTQNSPPLMTVVATHSQAAFNQQSHHSASSPQVSMASGSTIMATIRNNNRLAGRSQSSESSTDENVPSENLHLARSKNWMSLPVHTSIPLYGDRQAQPSVSHDIDPYKNGEGFISRDFEVTALRMQDFILHDENGSKIGSHRDKIPPVISYADGEDDHRSPHRKDRASISDGPPAPSSIWKRLLDAIMWKEPSLGVKIKQGLSGFANDSDISALADTGSRKNTISADYANRLGLEVRGSPCTFKLGNSTKVQSRGIVSLRWAFAENRKRFVTIICHVLPKCPYDLILGNSFLTATETMSRYRHRLTQCLFSVVNRFSSCFSFLGESSQRLEGTLADISNVLAVPDSGAERNVMSLDFAIAHGLEVKSRWENCNWLQFADGTYEATIGQVDTFWTFATGECIPVTFEILQSCCSDVIIGEEILTEHNVFADHASSLVSLEVETDFYELATFDFIRRWQKGLFGRGKRSKQLNGQDGPQTAQSEEQRLREFWNFRYNFGETANPDEYRREMARRSLYDSAASSTIRTPTVPSIPTAPSRHRRRGLPRMFRKEE